MEAQADSNTYEDIAPDGWTNPPNLKDLKQDLTDANGSHSEQVSKMEGWLDANPRKRKTKMGVKRFVNSWLSRAQDKGGSPDLASPTRITKTRDMTNLDTLTHNFTGDPSIREYYLAKHGQCFEDGVRYEA